MMDAFEIVSLASAALAGILLGGFYFGGLWWTAATMPRAVHPLRRYVVSLLVRLAVTLAAFYGVLATAGWPHLVVCLSGFVAARCVLTRLAGATLPAESPRREAG